MLFALRVPAGNERGALYAEQVMAALHQANPHRLPITLILGEHNGEIGTFIRCPVGLSTVVRNQLYAAYPSARIDPVPEAITASTALAHEWVAFLRLEPDIFPLKRYSQFDDAVNRNNADPLVAILSMIGADREGLRGNVEIELRPTSGRQCEHARRLLRRVATPFFQRHERLSELYLHMARSQSPLVRLGAAALGCLGRGTPDHQAEAALHLSGSRLHDREQQLQAAGDKLGRLLFDARIRLRVVGDLDRANWAHRKLQGLAGAFGVFAAPGLGRFHLHHKKTSIPTWLSAEEVATLWHPATSTVQSETLAMVHSRELPPPAGLPLSIENPGMPTVGIATVRGRPQCFGIQDEDRLRHVLIEGKTGMGKTSLLKQLLTSDIHGGRGVGLIDPHGDLADSLLGVIPSHRTNDVVAFDLADTQNPVAFNVLHCPNAADRPLVASGVRSAFKKLYGESWGPRLEHILRNCLLTLLEVPGTTLLSVLRLLSDAVYRRAILARVRDPLTLAFWEHEFGAWPQKFQAEAVAPIQNKVGHFVASPILRNVLGQARSTLDLRRVMDEGKILIVNLSKGKVGDDASALLGSLLVTSLQLAAMSRAEVSESQRRHFALYIDEFQNFATNSFATILSEARKYRLSLILANQYLAQMDEATLAAVFGNVGTLIAFQIGAHDAELVAEQLGPEVQPQDLLRLPRYHAYVRLLITGQPSRPFSMTTLPPNGMEKNPKRSTIVRRYSRQRYGRPIEAVRQEIARAMTA